MKRIMSHGEVAGKPEEEPANPAVAGEKILSF